MYEISPIDYVHDFPKKRRSDHSETRADRAKEDLRLFVKDMIDWSVS